MSKGNKREKRVSFFKKSAFPAQEVSLAGPLKSKVECDLKPVGEGPVHLGGRAGLLTTIFSLKFVV